MTPHLRTCNQPVNTRNTVVWVRGVVWFAKVLYRTHTHITCFGSTAGKPIPVRKPREKHVAKFFPWFNGLFEVTKHHPEMSSYILDIPNAPNTYLTYHATKLKRHYANNPGPFPSQELAHPGSIVMPDGLKEYHVQEAINS